MRKMLITITLAIVLAGAGFFAVGCDDSAVVAPKDNASTVLPLGYDKISEVDQWLMKVEETDVVGYPGYKDYVVTLILEKSYGNVHSANLGIKWDRSWGGGVHYDGYSILGANECSAHGDVTATVLVSNFAPCGTSPSFDPGVAWVHLHAGNHETERLTCDDGCRTEHGEYIEFYFSSTAEMSWSPPINWICDSDGGEPCTVNLYTCEGADTDFELFYKDIYTDYNLDYVDDCDEFDPTYTPACLH